MAKVLCVLYDDPVGGYPTSYAREDIPKVEGYPGGQTVPNPKQIAISSPASFSAVSPANSGCAGFSKHRATR